MEHRVDDIRMTHGVFFVATGERCQIEAVAAVGFLSSTNPGCPVTVFTDDVERFRSLGGHIPQVVKLEQPRYSFADKISGFLAAPYDQNVFLDTDAFLSGSVDHLHRLLDRFDLAAAHAPGGSGARFHSYESADLPPTFPQLNTGVVVFRRSPEAHATFERWAEIYEANPHHLHDQPSFRQALYESDLSLSVLPPEWNALSGAAYYSGPVHVFHAHGQSPATARDVIARMNTVTGPRLVTHNGMLLTGDAPAVATPAPARAATPRHGVTIRRNGPPVYHTIARADIPELLNDLGLTGMGVEVGVKEGKFSATILQGWKGRLLLSVDPWMEAAPDEYIDIANVPQSKQEVFLATTRERLAPFGDRSQIWRMTGDEAATQIEDGSLDFIYLDARHDYDSVKSDLDVWFPKVAPGGIISGHDYIDGDLPEGIFGVRSAVDEFFGARSLPVGITTNEPATFPSWIVAAPARVAGATQLAGAFAL